MDMLGLMKQAQALQSRVQDAQAQMEQAEVDGEAGGGLVKVTLTVKGRLVRLSLDPSLMRPEEAGIVEDLIVAAHEDARKKAERALEEKLKGVTDGLSLPAGFKLPF